ncbi:MAG: MFS transporter [Acidobacteriota bacterium]
MTTNEIKKTLRDSVKARWTAMILVSFAMFTGYLFTEVISPLKTIIEKSSMGWNSTEYGIVVSAYGWFNVFLAMLIIVGILLDKFGIRFSAISSAGTMVVGAGIKYYAFVGNFAPDATIFGLDARVMIAAFGYALFGVGVEYAGITASKAIVKWFKGKEIALAMGMQVAIARLGSFVPLAFGAKLAGLTNVSTPVLFGFLFLIIGLITFIAYNVMDKKLDSQLNENAVEDEDDKFKFSDLKVIFYNRGFWYIAILCVLFYSAVFPFYKYGPDLMVNKFGVSENWAGLIPSLVPFGTIFLTPLFGSIYDKKGKGASIMILGSFILVIVHVIYYLPFITSIWIAVFNAILLGIGFSLVPSAMWPSVPKIIPEKQLGSAFATIFWVQNWGLMGIPFAVGVVLDKLNPGVAAAKAAGESVNYDYSKTWLIFIGLTLLALVFSFLLKAEDKKKGYGLQLPNKVD